VSLTRVYATLNNLIIRKLGDTGGPTSSRVDEELNRIIAWAGASGRVINRDFSTVGNVGAGPDVLHSFTLPGGSLATDGDFVTVSYAGRAVNGETISFSFQFDGQATDTPAGLVAGASAHWLYEAEYARTSNTGIRAKYKFRGFGFTPSPDDQQVLELTVGSLGSDRVLRVLGDSTVTPNNNDVTQNFSIIKLYQQ
jgi:hypothetical protein